MKFISLFTKAPQHQRFSYRPRYYNPAKEEMKERVERIKKEIERERGIVTENVAGNIEGSYRTRIAGSFQAARKRSNPQQKGSETLMRLGIILFLTLLLIAYFQWGKSALYGAFVAAPIYLYWKFKQLKK